MRSLRELRGTKDHRRGGPGAEADHHHGDPSPRLAAQEVSGRGWVPGSPGVVDRCVCLLCKHAVSDGWMALYCVQFPPTYGKGRGGVEDFTSPAMIRCGSAIRRLV